MSYSFWCSNCKVDHAGECPPKKVDVKTARGGDMELSINGKKLGTMPMPFGYNKSQWHTPIFIAPDPGKDANGAPLVNTNWIAEARNKDTDPWYVGNPDYHYRVIRVAGTKAEVCPIHNKTLQATGSTFQYSLDWWKDDGGPDAYGGFIRMVYRP